MDNISAAITGESTPAWKQLPKHEQIPPTLVPLVDARHFFAVDASGSTSGSIIRSEQAFVQGVHQRGRGDEATLWGSNCNDPASVETLLSTPWGGVMGGTSPWRILNNPKSLGAILRSDVWYLLTDGQVGSYEVQRLSAEATEKEVLNVPVIFVITGTKRESPSSVDISVGITFFANAQDAICLFVDKNTGTIYTLASKGCFAALTDAHGNSTPDLSTWEHLRFFLNEEDFIANCQKNKIQVPSADTRITPTSGISLGVEWERLNGRGIVVDLDALLAARMLSNDDLEQLLAEEAFDNLSITCKTRGKIGDLRQFILQQKVTEMAVKLEDIAGANAIVARLGEAGLDNEIRSQLQAQLREAHATNRRTYQVAAKNALESPEALEARSRNRLVDRALQTLAEIESSGYTADILSRRSNRARRATTVAPTEGDVAIATLDLETPTAFRSDCLVCCGDNEVMSIAIKKGADGAFNTDNFALDFPLAAGKHGKNQDLISSQCVCFQCALLGRPGKSIYGEEISAVIPTFDYNGSNKKYVNEQLFLALTGGLRTGASGAAQLFMAMLDNTLKTKAWAGASVDTESLPDSEVHQRRTMFEWTLANMLQNTSCRETFDEQGPWVPYPKALEWAARNFQTEGLDSFAVRYPVGGFMQLVAFGKATGAFDDKTIRDLKATKVLHAVTSSFLAQLYRDSTGNLGEAWTQPLLTMVYSEFNADLVPVDFGGEESIVTSTDKFWAALSAFLKADTELLKDWEQADQLRIMPRVQLLLFWLIYHQKGHTSAKTFFHKLQNEQPLAPSVLSINTPLSTSAIEPTLLSIFRQHDASDHPTTIANDGNIHATAVVPFATPFGPSVLHCGICGEPFAPVSTTSSTPLTVDFLANLRAARATHLRAAFAGGTSSTGLPEPTLTPAPPSSTHCNLHVSVARAWAALSVETRDAAREDGSDAQVIFVQSAVKEICSSRRGDVFQPRLDDKVRELLPSFWDVLRVAAKFEGKEDWVEVEVDFALNKVEEKVKWEIKARELEG
ncbi:uncharacterized protein K452DRAFT_282973 [Aplosporella prunicola CBS 121167]|uniref:Uncharacterized protein n=1 Tax=Aplosporella prunicola CBS 121167 TaxID=1176127 RepID=A0A6A6BU80_9PEZI|nr:uncharacterized protein K452DRAFT_282973 [Aplosporella prunicola CBS 121167]KAF2146774.1 hypothetical protein K452DRAFT_282973 [Aplosporella prunicola CBS 121167]